MNRKVRVGSYYAYEPVMFDELNPPVNYVEPGQIVRVINKFGCPPANTMGMCYIEIPDMNRPSEKGEFIGMVCTNSLRPLVRKGKKFYIKGE